MAVLVERDDAVGGGVEDGPELGVDRLVCGSDIGQTPGPYSRIVDGLRDATRRFDPSERDSLLFGNAARIYAS